jgi:hypothetical protein
MFNGLLASLAPYKATLGCYCVTLFGSLTMYVLSLNNRMPVSSPVMRRLFPKRTEVSYDWSDFIVVVFVGSIVGTVVF